MSRNNTRRSSRNSNSCRKKLFNYEKLNRAFTKRMTSKEETVNIADSSDINSSSSSESNNYSTKSRKKKTSIIYDSDSADNGKISSSSTSSKYSNLMDG